MIIFLNALWGNEKLGFFFLKTKSLKNCDEGKHGLDVCFAFSALVFWIRHGEHKIAQWKTYCFMDLESWGSAWDWLFAELIDVGEWVAHILTGCTPCMLFEMFFKFCCICSGYAAWEKHENEFLNALEFSCLCLIFHIPGFQLCKHDCMPFCVYWIMNYAYWIHVVIDYGFPFIE